MSVKKHLSKDEPANDAIPEATDTPGGPISFASEILDEAPPNDGSQEAEKSAPRQMAPNWAKPAVAISGDRVRGHAASQPPPRDSLGTVTARLGARYWATNKRFEWALNSVGHHYEFTRYYFEQFVLVDVWARSNNSTRKEAQAKRAVVEAENQKRIKLGEKPIGYLSFVRGSIVPEQAFDDALAGKTLALIERASEGVLA
jgi:hypothetical protein